ncbi:MAG: Insertion element protein [Streptosporangiaceae bacterium]
MTPFYCPYCADEDLEPYDASNTSWRCRGCGRAFTLRFVGVEARL